MGALRIAIVGYGGAGLGIHARLAKEVGLTVTAVVTRDAGRRQQAASDWPGARLHDDLDALVAARAAYDLVVVTSPTALHADHAAHLARAGIPFVVDKPIGVDAHEARAVVAEAAATSTPFTVFHNRRWDAEELTLAALLSRRELGDVHTFERRWERWRPQPQQRWKENDVVGGGLLLDLGPHLVDSATQLFGRVTSVWAQARKLTTATEDDVFLVLQHEAGGGAARSPLAVTSRLWAGSVVGAPGPRTRVLGNGGAYVVTSFEQDASPFEVLDADAPAGTLGWLTRGRERTAVPQAPGGHLGFYRALVEWLTADGEVPVDPADAVRTAEVLDAARTSAREGRTITV
ncbi:oxidoreductase domain protein [Xylanimonas cellulosilytica DSM 15894]|uniref:Oxidoreductase domain protein n=1 Tax=Xylanimonas cellulosilytica (strain DSM 15894 / JCM 12276 / CECT 5975 / KCTC 9989 / LMG 20990 / NBRC 107835 / XIL07) TaxID=446471 RepID=D1BTS3_XYLCX|nr:Gfo/Idh/MocA family oxidoreductase [Xylanimonas cellulosilytica]ACZ31052.1 oxidoreductase domain protein [Xylanimonas cellulosilytica DSM 15894]